MRQPCAVCETGGDRDRPVRPRRDDPVDVQCADVPLDRGLVLGGEDAAPVGVVEPGRGRIAVDDGDPQAARTRRLEQSELSGAGP
jgi:hypothetical protein